eukprot:TRINITY_DN58646_c0_g1_i1.p1 TRINITY_DN58646_c0_g1~~TRINITY_DN58646_c0_g1_i1.p1  ORF type:complete len:159 (-),score=32.96 TRINITY_DN58646_c0_g1_i1:48-524(-)
MADERPLRSKGLLPALGVGAAVYAVSGVVSLTALGLVGVGAGVGYGVGQWFSKKVQERKLTEQMPPQPYPQQPLPGNSAGELPHHLQVSLQAWQNFLSAKAQASGLQQLAPKQVEEAFLEFRRVEPQHAANVTSIIHSTGGVGVPLLKPERNSRPADV